MLLGLKKKIEKILLKIVKELNFWVGKGGNLSHFELY